MALLLSRFGGFLLTCHGSSDQSFLDDGPLLIRLAFPDQPER